MSGPPRIVKPTASALTEACKILKAGGLVAIPTETVYGLAGDATNDRAVAAIFAAKSRPQFNPLIAHVHNLRLAMRLAEFGPLAQRLALKFWPGPLTLVLRRRAPSPLSLLLSAGLETVALRMPGHGVARALIGLYGRPLAAPSANRSGRISATSAEDVAEELGAGVDLILDGGPSQLGIESTVVDLSRETEGERPMLLRPGAVTEDDLVEILGEIDRPKAGDPLRSPGQMESHYAPARPLRLEARSVGAQEALIAFGPQPPTGAGLTLNLSETGDLTEAAAHLFAYLRQADASGLTAIAVMPIPETGLGQAINDRLRRAAHPR